MVNKETNQLTPIGTPVMADLIPIYDINDTAELKSTTIQKILDTGYVGALTSDAQTQLDGKEPIDSSVFRIKADGGAVGDGVADDTTAIQTALTNQNTIRFEAGTYNITTALTVSKSNLHIILDRGATIKATGGFSGIMLTVGNGSTVYTNIKIQGDGTIDGNSLASQGVKIHGPISDIKLSNFELKNTTGTKGIEITGQNTTSGRATSIKVNGLFVHDIYEGIFIAKAAKIIVSNNITIDALATGQDLIELSECIGFTVADNYCDNPGPSNSCIDIFEDSQYGVVSGNVCRESNARTGVRGISFTHTTNPVKYVKVTGNIIEGSFVNGVDTGTTESFIDITDNQITVTGAVSKAISHQGTDSIISHNTLLGSTSNCILTTGSSARLKIFENDVTPGASSTSAPITVDGGASADHYVFNNFVHCNGLSNSGINHVGSTQVTQWGNRFTGSVVVGFIDGATEAGNTIIPDSTNAIKDPCQLATTANITLSGEQTIDGVLTSSSRVLVKNQSTASQNGIYTTSSGAWTRTNDFSANVQIKGNTLVMIQQGTANADSLWYLDNTGTITIGTTSLVFTEFVGGGGLANIVEDTTPQLGGNLDFNSFKATGVPNPTANDEIVNLAYFNSNTETVTGTKAAYKAIARNSGDTANEWTLITDNHLAGSISNGKLATNPLARANHTGTQTVSTISDFDTAVAANSAVTANTAKVTNATHTGEVTGSTALTLDKTAITNRTLDERPDLLADQILSHDSSASALKKLNILDIVNPTALLRAGYNTGAICQNANSAYNATGIFAAGTTAGTVSNSRDADGRYINYQSAASGGAVAADRSTVVSLQRQHNFVIAFRFKLAQNDSDTRLFIGVISTAGTVSGDDPLSGIQGVGLVKRASDTNFFIGKNNNTTSDYSDAGIAVDTNVHVFSLRAVESGTKFQWSLDGSAWADITGVIPGSTTVLGHLFQVQTVVATAKSIQNYGIAGVSK